MNKDEMRRKRENERVLSRLFSGDSLEVVDVRAIFFPPRPIIKKDKNALEFFKREVCDNDTIERD